MQKLLLALALVVVAGGIVPSATLAEDVVGMVPTSAPAPEAAPAPAHVTAPVTAPVATAPATAPSEGAEILALLRQELLPRLRAGEDTQEGHAAILGKLEGRIAALEKVQEGLDERVRALETAPGVTPEQVQAAALAAAKTAASAAVGGALAAGSSTLAGALGAPALVAGALAAPAAIPAAALAAGGAAAWRLSTRGCLFCP